MIVHGARRYAAIKPFDEALSWALALLLSISLVMVYSASIAYAEADAATHNRYFYLIRHLIFMTIGLSAAYIAFQIPTAFWQKYSGKIFLIGLVLLVLVLVPGIGKMVNGSRRWINLFVLNLQPSEVMKFATVLYAADYTVRKSHLLHSLKEGFAPMFAAMVVVAFCAARAGLRRADGGDEHRDGRALPRRHQYAHLQRAGGDGGGRHRGADHLLAVSLEAGAGFHGPVGRPVRQGLPAVSLLDRHRARRVVRRHSGGSIEKLFYLPEAHTDFIMAVISEEFGFIGICVVIGLYAWIVRRAFHIGVESKKLERYYQSLVAQGLGIWLGIQVFFNIGVNMGLLPTRG